LLPWQKKGRKLKRKVAKHRLGVAWGQVGASSVGFLRVREDRETQRQRERRDREESEKERRTEPERERAREGEREEKRGRRNTGASEKDGEQQRRQ
jgi:hypothetical protein